MIESWVNIWVEWIIVGHTKFFKISVKYSLFFTILCTLKYCTTECGAKIVQFIDIIPLYFLLFLYCRTCGFYHYHDTKTSHSNSAVMLYIWTCDYCDWCPWGYYHICSNFSENVLWFSNAEEEICTKKRNRRTRKGINNRTFFEIVFNIDYLKNVSYLRNKL